MSKYFEKFPTQYYRFGNNEQAVLFPSINTFVEVLDLVKDNISAYNKITVTDAERPDTLSNRLYGTPDHYWTFFLMNEALREQGWPLTDKRIYDKSEELYPDWFLEIDGYSSSNVAAITALSNYTKGETIAVYNGSAWLAGTVKGKNIQNGELYFSSTAVTTATNITQVAFADESTNLLSVSSNSEEYNGTHHYERSDGTWYDLVDGAVGSPITFQENLVNVNEELRTMRVIKPEKIEEITFEYKRSLKRANRT